MYYWNKHNFEGLIRLAEELEQFPNLHLLARYCRLREQGVRRAAMSVLEQFLNKASSFDTSASRECVIQILELSERFKSAHQFLTQPLVSRLLFPTLHEWSDHEPENNVPIRWLGILGRDYELLAKALAMCPEDVPVRQRLIDHELSYVELATHHLDEGHFIGNVEDSLAALRRASELLTNAPDSKLFNIMESERAHLEGLLAAWKTYSLDPRGTFPEWCAGNGKHYTYPIKVYYAEGTSSQ